MLITEVPPKSSASGHVDYGIDAPGVVRTFFLIGAVGVLIGTVCIVASKSENWHWVEPFTWPLLSIGIVFVAQGLVMIWGSKRGKLLLRNKLIAEIPLRGDEMVLDVGCGHGLMLIGAAKRLRSGKAIGIDLWQREDQAGNSRGATWRNVEVKNVADRVELQDGDARKLPFADNSFDVILSSWALHNIYDSAGRAQAIREIVRVLKPGGRVVIVDIRHSAEYEVIFRESGMIDVSRKGPNFLFVIPSYTVTAKKPNG